MTTEAKPRYPTIADLSALVRAIKPQIEDDYLEEDETIPGIDLTIGWSDETFDWSYQTGDNSYMGSAYHYPVWAVSRVYRRSNSRELARDLIDQLEEQYWSTR
jgi:hypothetical protein